MTINKSKYYNSDLAFVHNHGYKEFAQNAAQTIWQLIEGKPEDILVVDLGCGSGILEKELAEKCNIIGVDNAPAMIEIAKQNAPEATFFTDSIYDFNIPECDLICAIGECFNYLFDNKPDLNELRKIFTQIYSSLKPEGYFVFDILTSELLNTAYINSRIIEQDNWTMFLDIKGDNEEHILTRKIILFLRKEEGYTKSKETHTQRLYIKKDIEAILIDLGFDINQIQGYNGLIFRPGHIGFVCRKK